MSALISADMLRWLLCPAIDADASWLPAHGPARETPSRNALRRASLDLLQLAPRVLPRPPLSVPWCRWLMQPTAAIHRRLCVLTAALLQPTIRRHIHGPRRKLLLAALGPEGFHEALDCALDVQQERQIATLEAAEPDWANADESRELGLALACNLLDVDDAYMGFRMRLKFNKALAPALGEPQSLSLGAPVLHALAKAVLLEAFGDEHR
jgi:hypothetical protein